MAIVEVHMCKDNSFLAASCDEILHLVKKIFQIACNFPNGMISH